jgi:NTP pyrophosphatase (non-canonical NTP hydrolase)
MTVTKETQATVTQWIEDTFGPADSNARVLARANEEMAELLRSVTMDDRHPDIPEEMADVVIVMYRVATSLGVDLLAEVDKKMAVNRARKWDLDGSGCGYHTE